MALPQTEDQWRDMAKGILKAELKKQNVKYAELAERLVGLGVDESEATVRNKLSRGAFSFTFALQCMAALGVTLIPFKADRVYEGVIPSR